MNKRKVGEVICYLPIHQRKEKKDSAKSCPTLATSWIIARQAPLSIGCSKQEWSGLPFLSPGDLPDPGIEARSPALQADFLPIELSGKPHLHTN